MGILWHYMRQNHGYQIGWADLAVFMAAILVLIRPQKPHFLFATAAITMVVYLMGMPQGSNHWTMQFLVNASLCGSFVMLALQRRTWRLDSRDWLDAFRPLVCMLVVLLYLFASLHKLNSAYFSEDGFARSLYLSIAGNPQLLAFANLLPTDEAFLAIVPHLSILVELGIPILLLFRPTRLLGIFVGMTFHTFLSLRLYPWVTDFPVVVGAAYILFLPAASIDILEWRHHESASRQAGYYETFKRLVVPAVLLALIFVPTLYELPRRVTIFWFRFSNLKSVHWVLYAALYIGLLVFLMVRLRSIAGDRSLSLVRAASLPLSLILAVTIFLTMSPYLGLRTSGAFSMFSNLETEGGASNHYFMPLDLQVFDYLKQVCVIETSADDIPATAASGELLTWSEFRKLARSNPDASITYTFEGERFELARIADKPQLVADADLLERFYVIVQRRGRGSGYCDGLG